jgi:DNA-binding MarR family transcriptional regulator
MTRRALPFFDTHSEPLSARIATGLHKVGLAMKQQSWQQASEEGLSATQGQILAALVASGPLTGSELRERLALTLPTISDSVGALVQKGLVTKEPDPRHPRASLLTLTEQGRARGERARAWPEFLASAVDTLSAPEQAVFFTSIVKMIRTLQERGQVPISGMCVSCTHFRPHAHEGLRPHHCTLVDAPMADVHLRLDCLDHERLEEPARSAIFELFVRSA